MILKIKIKRTDHSHFTKCDQWLFKKKKNKKKKKKSNKEKKRRKSKNKKTQKHSVSAGCLSKVFIKWASFVKIFLSRFLTKTIC